MYRQESLRQAPQNPAGCAAVVPSKVMMNRAWQFDPQRSSHGQLAERSAYTKQDVTLILRTFLFRSALLKSLSFR